MAPIRRSILKIYGWALVIGLGYVLWLRITGIGIPCLFRESTGLLCPGCGVSRMFLALLRLDIAGAFRNNGAAFCLLCYWNLTALLCFHGRPAFLRSPRFLYGSLWISVGVLVMFGVLRNVL